MRKAFTLYEIIVIIVVIGILAAVTIPRLGNNKLLKEGNKLLGWIRYTQHLAMVDDKFEPRNKNWRKNGWCIKLSDPTEVFSNYYDNNGLLKKVVATDGNGKDMIKNFEIEINTTEIICFDEIGRPFKDTIEYRNILKRPYSIRISYAGESKIIKIWNETGYTTFDK